MVSFLFIMIRMLSKKAQLVERIFRCIIDKSVRIKNPKKKNVRLSQLSFSTYKVQIININDCPIYIIGPKHQLNNKAIMYIHGGGFVTEITRTH
ncbi:hypothetical protein FACS1894218_2450 [Bacilli bacterium]|nr:hypothetical protein FACS1894218_2450 [Bacilli bacterium]